jgi:hypothetical protein
MNNTKYRIIFLVSFSIGFQIKALPQTAPTRNWKMDIAFSGNKNLLNLAFSGSYQFVFGRKELFFLQPGLRLNNLLHDGVPGIAGYYPVGSDSKNQFTPGYIPSANVFFQAELKVVKKVRIGFSLDVVGVGYNVFNIGKANKDFITSSNLLLGPGRDSGSLNSDFYLSYFLGHNIFLKMGLSHYSLAYKDEEGERKVKYFNLGFVGLHFPF